MAGSRLKKGQALRLDAPLRGVIYGLALVVAVPLAWSAGKVLSALVIGGIAVVGIGLEVFQKGRRRKEG